MTTETKDTRLERLLRQVRDAESRLEDEEDVFMQASHEECTRHNNLLRAGADELDEQVRHETEITRLRAPLDAARAVAADAINAYMREFDRG